MANALDEGFQKSDGPVSLTAFSGGDLYMAAVVAACFNPLGKALYRRLRERGKSAKSALIAVAHKLLTIANAMVAQKTVWRHSDVAKVT